ncbi:MAG: potassium channel protein [Ignavibacteriae bacterium]|nr:potassium channel protein [Ignavibacteriota bacterium]
MDKDLKRRLLGTGIALLTILSIGTFGYYFLSDERYNLFTCLYFTVITITTIGFDEVVLMEDQTNIRMFTMVLAFLGIGLLTYFVSTVSVVFVDGHLRKSFKKRKMEKNIKNMEKHYIVCGIGRHSLHLMEELSYYSTDNVCIEINSDVIENVKKIFTEMSYIEGDASEDEVLLKAGIERAEGIFASTSDDNLNLVICLSARRLNPDIKIVSLCVNHRNLSKIKLAGANKIVSTNYISGLRMASEMLRPSSTHVLDIVSGEKHKNIKIEEIIVTDKEDGKSIANLKDSKFKDSLIIAIKSEDELNFKPNGSTILNKNDELIVLRTPK